MKILATNFNNIFTDPFCRMDFNNKSFFDKNDFSTKEKLSKYMTFIETGKPITKADYSNEENNNIHFVVRNISHNGYNLDNPIYLRDETAKKYKPFRLQKGDIVLAISANCGAAFYFEEQHCQYDFTLSHYLCRFRVDSNVINPNFLTYYLNSTTMKQYFRSTETGKTQKNLSKVYIRNIPMFDVPIDTQNNIISTIQSIESKITQLEESITNTQVIIDSVFKDEFDFNYSKFESLKSIKIFSSDFFEFSNNPDVRMSAKFHRQAGEFVMQELSNITTKKIKHYLSEPIILGASITPSDYDDEGKTYYLSMATVKNWEFSPLDARKVFSRYTEGKKAKYKTVQANDIILTRSGEGTIGKVALIEDDDLKAIFSDFTMRIRLENYNQKFAYYYFRTMYFQYLIQIHKKGLGNNTNIFPIMIKEFPTPDISITEQDRISAKIQQEINKQNIIRSKIAQLRAKIDEIVERTVTSGE